MTNIDTELDKILKEYFNDCWTELQDSEHQNLIMLKIHAKSRLKFKRLIIQELQELDYAYHDNIDMQSTITINELKEAGIEEIGIEDQRTQNNVFRHIQRRIKELKGEL